MEQDLHGKACCPVTSIFKKNDFMRARRERLPNETVREFDSVPTSCVIAGGNIHACSHQAPAERIAFVWGDQEICMGRPGKW
ncbi:MAG: hypothetical protein CMM01_07800 [Rhodopirellula sp.]|nr:hypothetical protein [Rhodopirellula sp.]